MTKLPSDILLLMNHSVASTLLKEGILHHICNKISYLLIRVFFFTFWEIYPIFFIRNYQIIINFNFTILFTNIHLSYYSQNHWRQQKYCELAIISKMFIYFHELHVDFL